MFLRLTARLKTVADMIPKCGVMADIGCDHGRLAAFVLQNDIASRVIAADISPYSIEKARSLMEKCGLSARCSLRQGDGLSVLVPGEAETIVITGLGGPEMIGILADDDRRATYIVQPQNQACDVRRFLAENGYQIIDEEICREKDRFYEIICFRAGEMRLSPLECELGPVNLQKGKDVLFELKEKRLSVLLDCIRRLEGIDAPKANGDRVRLMEKLALYRELKGREDHED